MRKELKKIEVDLDNINGLNKSSMRYTIRKRKGIPFIETLENEF